MPRSDRRLLLLLAAILLLAAAAVWSSTYPTCPDGEMLSWHAWPPVGSDYECEEG